MSYAQTYIQLINQLLSEGYSESDIGYISDTYQLTMQLFSGQYRSSGKTFVSHLVGTASILTALHTKIEIISAGLIHSAYTHGDFGSGLKSFVPQSKRHQVRQSLGTTIENYVDRYTHRQWYTLDAILNIYQTLEQLEPIEQDVIVIHLANELEECLDVGLLYCQDAKFNSCMNSHSHLLPVIAEKLGYPQLAQKIHVAFKLIETSTIPQSLRNQFPTSSFLVAPKSYKQKLSAILLKKLKQIKLYFSDNSLVK